MEKVLSFPAKVDDIIGLYIDLKKSSFSVRNVAADERGTYVYLDEYEEKDPGALVEAWVGRPIPDQTASLQKKRMKELEEAESMAVPEEQASLIRRLFRKIF